MIKFRAFRAINEPETCSIFLAGHIKVLEDWGIENITSNNFEWMDNPGTYCIVAELKSTNQIIAGIRVQVGNGTHPLPVVGAVGKYDKRIVELIEVLLEDGGVGELCGLWTSKQTSGLGLGLLLSRAGVAIVSQLKFNTMVGICAGYSLSMFKQVGFVVNEALGKEGDFNYPNEKYIANVVGVLNAQNLWTAKAFDRQRILDLRKNPRQIYKEQGKNQLIEIEYDLVIPL